MGWYDAVYGRPGHETPPDAPQKKGFARFAEIVLRDFPQLMGCNALCCVLMLPPALLISMGVMLESFWMTLAFGMLSGLFAAPAAILMACCVLRSLQDDPRPFLDLAKEALRKNLRRGFALGVLMMALGAGLAFVTHYLFSVAAQAGYYPGLGILAMLVLDDLVFAIVFGMAWMSILPCGDSLGRLIRSGLELAVQAGARGLGACVLLLVCTAAAILLFPVSIFGMVLVGFWLPALLAGLLVYPALEKRYSLRSYRKAQPAPAPGGEKAGGAANWWHYHWGVVLVCTVIALGVWYVAYTLLTEIDPDYSVAVVTAQALPDEAISSLETSLAALADDANGDGKVVVEVNNYTWSLNASATEMDTQMAGSARMITDLNAGDSAIWVLEDAAAFEEGFSSLSEKYGSGWRQDVALWADMPVLAGLPLGTYSQSLETDTATPVQSLFAQDSVVLLGESNPLWQAIAPKQAE